MNYVNQLFSFIIIFGSYFSFQPCVCNGYCNIWQMDVNDVNLFLWSAWLLDSVLKYEQSHKFIGNSYLNERKKMDHYKI